jgi:hypothetical protein
VSSITNKESADSPADFIAPADGWIALLLRYAGKRVASPVPAVLCIEKERLLKAFAQAVSEHHRMQSAQVAAVLRGQDFPFEEEIARAAARREEAKYNVIAHQTEHGC